MGDLGVISNQLRGLSDKSSFLAAEGLNEIQSQLDQVYSTFGFSDSLTANHAGFRIGAIQTNLLEILGDSLEPQMRISALDDQTGDVLIEMDEARIRFLHPSAFAATADGIYTNFGPSKYQIVAGALGAAFQLESTVVAGVYVTELVMFDPAGTHFAGLHVAAADIYLLLSSGTYSIKADTTPASASLRVAGPTDDFTISPTKIVPGVNLAGSLGDSTHFLGSAYVENYNVYNQSGTANTFLTITGAFDQLSMAAFSSGGAAGRVRLTASNAAASFFTEVNLDGAAKSISLTGHTDILNDSLSATGLKIKDASGTTTGNSFEIQKNDGTVIFKVIGSTDAGAPGTVVSRDIIPFTDLLYNLGNVTHRWSLLYGGNIDLVSASLGLQGLVMKDANGTTTGNSFELKTFGGTTFFKIIGGTDSGAPGTVVTRDLVPFTDNTYKLGNNTHYWNFVYTNNIAASGDLQLSAGGNIVLATVPKFNTDGTGGGAALLGANCPAVTVGAPHAWLSVKTADGSTAYVPAWK